MKERILCAAIWYKNEEKPVHSVTNLDKGVVIGGFGHANIIGTYKSLTGERTPEQEYEQGFLTSKNRFVSRNEAAKIAFESKQVDWDETMIEWDKIELYSEDINK